MPQLTILIPHHRSFGNENLEETILSALENRGDDSEILVVTDGGYRDPYSLSGEEVTFLSLAKDSSLVRCVNAGVEAARAAVTCVLTPGTLWGNGSLSRILSAFDDLDVAAAVPGIVDRNRPDRAISTGVLCRPCGAFRNHKPGRTIPDESVFVPHQAGAFFRTAILRQNGGFLPQFSLQAAYADFCFLAELAGLQTVQLPAESFFALPSQRIFASPFEQAKQCELFYRLWRHCGDFRRNRQRHFDAIVTECQRNFPSLRMFRLLAGRLAGAFSGEIPAEEIQRRRSPTVRCEESPYVLKIFDGNEHEKISDVQDRKAA